MMSNDSFEIKLENYESNDEQMSQLDTIQRIENELNMENIKAQSCA